MRLLQPSALILAIALALSACGSSTPDSSTSTFTPGVASIAVTSVVDNQATVDWNLTSSAFAEQWSLYQNDLRVCSGEPLAAVSSEDNSSYQTGSCSITLQVGSNSLQVQLCNVYSSNYSLCSQSATEIIDYQEQTELGAISWRDFPSSSTTSESELYLSWGKEEGINGDYWHIYQNDALACSGVLDYSETFGGQSGGCDVALALGANDFQAQLCQRQPVGIADNCVQSSVASVTFDADPQRILATAVLAELDESLPASYDISISWSKDSSSGSAGEDWSLLNNGIALCQGTLVSDADGGSCSAQLVEGSNQLQVRLCTDIATYSGASCAYSATVAVEGFDPEPLAPGTLSITSSIPAQVTDAPSLIVDWEIASGNGVSSWSVAANAEQYCYNIDPEQYYWNGSCQIDLEAGVNTISVTGCNYGYENSESCSTSLEVSTEYVVIPGSPELTSSFPASTYLSEHNLSWELVDGEAADYWLAVVNDTSKCSGDLLGRLPQSGSCMVELDSGVNAIVARLCIGNESGSSYCSDSAAAQVELLAPVPAQPEISTPAQTIADDTILLEWSKSGGDNGSYWSADNNMAAVAACVDRPLLSSGSSQSGSCDLALELGENLISVHLCNDNAAGTASCSTSESIIINRESAAPEFTSAASVSVAENSTGVIHTIQASDVEGDSISYALAGADFSHFSLDSSSGELAIIAPLDYESPLDATSDNSYELEINASDGLNSAVQAFTVNLSDLNDETPQATSPQSLALELSSISLGVAIYTVTASDADAGDQLSYSHSGADASHFSLDSRSGDLRFIVLPSGAASEPIDANGDSVYELDISVSDLALNSSSFELSIAVADDIGSAPEFAVVSASVGFDENGVGAVYTAQASDADDDVLIYSIAGVDSSLFTIDSASGELSFISPPDYDIPLDYDSNNIYQLSITASDGEYQSGQDLAISISNINEPPSFTQASVSPTTAENNASFVHTVAAAIDEDQGQQLTYTISGADQADFSFDPATLELAFITTPDYETPLDQDANNVYQLTITASDGEYSASQDLSIAVTDVNEAPSASISVSPDPSSTTLTTLTAVSLDGSSSSDPDGDSLAYTWSQPSSQAIDLSSPNSASTSFTAAAVGTYSFTLTVADGALDGSAEVTLEIASASILPDDFTATAASAQVTLAWTPYSGSTTYNIYRSTDADCELDSYATACSSSAGALFPSVLPGFIDSNLTDGTTYYYWIEASLNGSTQRAASPISATPQPSAIAEPIPGTLNDTGVDWGGDYDNGNNSACSSNVSAPQDCHQGRDATHDDDSDGHAGFAFTKLDSSGNALEADATGLVLRSRQRNRPHLGSKRFIQE